MRGYGKKTGISDEFISKEYASGKTAWQIATENGFSISTVVFRLKKLGQYQGDTRGQRKYEASNLERQIVKLEKKLAELKKQLAQEREAQRTEKALEVIKNQDFSQYETDEVKEVAESLVSEPKKPLSEEELRLKMILSKAEFERRKAAGEI